MFFRVFFNVCKEISAWSRFCGPGVLFWAELCSQEKTNTKSTIIQIAQVHSVNSIAQTCTVRNITSLPPGSEAELEAQKQFQAARMAASSSGPRSSFAGIGQRLGSFVEDDDERFGPKALADTFRSQLTALQDLLRAQAAGTFHGSLDFLKDAMTRGLDMHSSYSGQCSPEQAMYGLVAAMEQQSMLPKGCAALNFVEATDKKSLCQHVLKKLRAWHGPWTHFRRRRCQASTCNCCTVGGMPASQEQST